MHEGESSPGFRVTIAILHRTLCKQTVARPGLVDMQASEVSCSDLWHVLGVDRSTCHWGSQHVSFLLQLCKSMHMAYAHQPEHFKMECGRLAGILRMHMGTQEAQRPAGLPWAHTSWQSWRDLASCSCKVSCNHLYTPLLNCLALTLLAQHHDASGSSMLCPSPKVGLLEKPAFL